ncbi:DsrE family protein [Chitinophaga lutea]
MRNLLLAVLLLSFGATRSYAQDHAHQNRSFTGAIADQKRYKAIYQLDQASPDIIKKAIRNINNLLNDPRLKGKVQVELVAFSGGTEAFKKTSGFEADIKGLVDKGVIVAQCLNTLREKNISKDELYDFLAFVPSGNGELVIRGAQGWVIVKP